MLVSILIPCRNAERWIGLAIESALSQSHSPVEVIVVDDGSSDGSARVILGYGDKIRWEQARHRGGNATRNRLLELSSGPWLQFLDADDYLLPNKIAAQLLEFDLEQVDVAFAPIIEERWKGDVVVAQGVLDIPIPHDPAVLLALWHLPQTGGALWRRSAVAEAGGWKVDQPCCQEHELYLRMLMRGCRFQYCPTPGATYRLWSEETVCRRDPTQTLRNRLDILRRLRQYLDETSQNTLARSDAIAESRYQCARSLYAHQPSLARQAAEEARRDHPRFRLPERPAFPRGYRWAHRGLGFSGAEKLASWSRQWKSAQK